MSVWLYFEGATHPQVAEALREQCGLVSGDSGESPVRYEVTWHEHERFVSLRADNGCDRFGDPASIAKRVSSLTKASAGCLDSLDANHVQWNHLVAGKTDFVVSTQSNSEEIPSAWRAGLASWKSSWAGVELTLDRMESLITDKLGAAKITRPWVLHRRFVQRSLPVLAQALRLHQSLSLGPLTASPRGLRIARSWKSWLDGQAGKDDLLTFETPAGLDAKALEAEVRALLEQANSLTNELLVLDDVAFFERQALLGYQGRNPSTGESIEVAGKVILYGHDGPARRK